jgi:putative alpha-1,2-mannosidase
MTLHLKAPAEKTFTILARNLTRENCGVKSIKLDGRPLATPFLKHTDLLQGKVLEFEMGPPGNR